MPFNGFFAFLRFCQPAGCLRRSNYSRTEFSCPPGHFNSRTACLEGVAHRFEHLNGLEHLLVTDGRFPGMQHGEEPAQRVVQMVRISMELFGKKAASAEQRYVERKISRLARFVGPKPVECCQRTVRAFQYHHSRAVASA